MTSCVPYREEMSSFDVQPAKQQHITSHSQFQPRKGWLLGVSE